MRFATIAMMFACMVWNTQSHAQTTNQPTDGETVPQSDTSSEPGVDQSPSSDDQSETASEAETTEVPSDSLLEDDENALLLSDAEKQAQAKARLEAARKAMIAELDPLILGSWGLISGRGAAGISDNSILAGVGQCRRTKTVNNPEYASDAAKVLPEEIERRGNIVFYKTEKGLQRLDVALRNVFLISTIEKDPTGKNPNVWKLGTPKGNILAGFGTIRRKGRRFPVFIEQNAVYVRCTKPKTDG